MTIENPYISYTTDGVKTNFTFPFELLIATDLTVWLTPSGEDYDPVGDVITNYTVNINSSPSIGGSIDIDTPPASNGSLVIRRTMEEEVPTNFESVQTITGERLDDVFTRISLILQQNAFNINGQALHYPPNAPSLNEETTEVAVLKDGEIWKRVSGKVIGVTLDENPDVSALRSELASQTNGADGASIIGVYDTLATTGKTLAAYLADLDTRLTAIEGTVPPTGSILHYWGPASGLGSEWLDLDDSEIGNASSNATHAGATYENLFTLLWNNITQDYAQVRDSSGVVVTRGASAAADWSANRQIDLPKTVSRFLRPNAGVSSTNNKVDFTAIYTTDPNVIFPDKTSIVNGTFRFATGMEIVLTTTGTLPTPLVTGTPYYVSVNDVNSINIATSPENLSIGDYVTLTDNGTGTHTLTMPNYGVLDQGATHGSEQVVQLSSEVGVHKHELPIRAMSTGGSNPAYNTNSTVNSTVENTESFPPSITPMDVSNPQVICRAAIKL